MGFEIYFCVFQIVNLKCNLQLNNQQNSIMIATKDGEVKHILLIYVFSVLLVQIACEQSNFQCQTGQTIRSNKYGIDHVYNSGNQQQILQKIDFFMDQTGTDQYGYFHALFYLVRKTSTDKLNTILMKTMQGDGTIRTFEYQLSSQIVFFDTSSPYGVAVTDDHLMHLFTYYFDRIELKYQFSYSDNSAVTHFGSSTYVPLTLWTPVRLALCRQSSLTLVFKQPGTDNFHFIYAAHNQVFYIWYTLIIPDGKFDVSHQGMSYHSNKFYLRDVEADLSANFDLTGNEKLFGIGTFDFNTRTYDKNMISGIWSFDAAAAGGPQTNLHLYYVLQQGVGGMYAGYLTTITTTIFPNISNIQFYYSTKNEHFVEYDGEHLRFSLARYNDQYYSFTTDPSDDIYSVIKNGAVLQFSFYNEKMTIITGTQIHIVALQSGYKTSTAPQTFTSQHFGYTLTIRKSLAYETDIRLERSISMGTDIVDWIRQLNSTFIVTKTACTCEKSSVPEVRCFSNVVCIFAENSAPFPCSDIDYQRYLNDE